MLHRPRRNRLTLSLAIALVSAGCASSTPGVLTAQPVEGSERPVDAREDNRAVLESITEGLVVQLAIDGDRVELTDAQVLSVPKLDGRRLRDGMIGVSGLRDGESIYSTAIPDELLNIQEQEGLVVVRKRTLSVSLPTGGPVTALEVRLGPEGEPQRIDLAPFLGEWCGRYRQERDYVDRWCDALEEDRGQYEPR